MYFFQKTNFLRGMLYEKESINFMWIDSLYGKDS